MANLETTRARAVLAEIPTELGFPIQHRAVNHLGALRRNALNPALIDSPAANIPDSFLSPRMSPDEAVIQQRGRRRVPIMWSPEKGFQSPNKTPTKSISAMTLRSSPRKRSLIRELSDVRVSGIDASHSSPSNKKNTPSKGSPGSAKKLRLQEGSINRSKSEVPLETLLKGFSQDQLIAMITGMVQTNPRLEDVVRSELPVPDIAPLEEQLCYQKRNIFKSLPATRLVSKTDSPAYARAATHLAAFKKTLIDQSQSLQSSKHWDALLDYVLMAWNYVRLTPVWDNHAHNAIRRHCFKILSYHANSALKNGSTGLGKERIERFHAKLKLMGADCEDINDCNVCIGYLLNKI